MSQKTQSIDLLSNSHPQLEKQNNYSKSISTSNNNANKQSSQNQKEQLQNKQQDDVIDPVKQLIDNANPLPIIAVINHFQLDQQIQPGKPLIHFLTNKFLPLDQIIKDRRVQLKQDSAGKTPLHHAVEADDVKSAHWCLENHNPNVRDNSKYSPIMIAIKNGYRRCFLLCLQYGHYDQCAPHVAAAYNRVWELQVLNSLKYRFLDVRDSASRTPIDVAVQSYSYQAAQYLASLQGNSLNVSKLQNLTDSKAIIRRVKRSIKNTSIVHRKIIPFLKIFLTMAFLLVSSQTIPALLPYESFYLYSFLIMTVGYLIMGLLNCLIKTKYSTTQNLMALLKAPDFPTLEQICPKCLHFVTPQFDHCDQCGCCRKGYHYHDWMCINYSNQGIWVLLELSWFLLCLRLFDHFNDDLYIITQEQLPIFIFPFRLLMIYFKNKDWMSFAVMIVGGTCLIHSFFYLLEMIGIMFMGRTYQHVNHSQRYEHLYRVVKLRDGTLRNKQIRVFEDGFLLGLVRGARNIIKFFFC